MNPTTKAVIAPVSPVSGASCHTTAIAAAWSTLTAAPPERPSNKLASRVWPSPRR